MRNRQRSARFFRRYLLEFHFGVQSVGDVLASSAGVRGLADSLLNPRCLVIMTNSADQQAKMDAGKLCLLSRVLSANLFTSYGVGNRPPL